MGIRRKFSVSDGVILFVLLLCMAACLIPLLNTVAISLSDRASAQRGDVVVWPVNLTTAPYEELMKDAQFLRSFWISVQRVLLGGSLNMVLTILSAYPLSKSTSHFRAKNKYMWFFVFLMLFNGGMVPTFVLVSNLGLINSVWALILPGAVPIFNCIVLMNYYKTIPASLEEAALIDGAGPWYILVKIYVPLSLAPIAVTALWSIVGHWNEFFSGIIYMTSKRNYPLQTYIQSLSVSIDWQNINWMKGEDIARMMKLSNLTFTSAKVVVSMIPILLIYPFLARYFVTGIVMGAVKE